MSELYSSESGSYETYLSERQVDKITTTIKQATDIQMMGMAATTGVLGAKLDSMNAKLKIIGTGLYTAVSKNTLQIAASTEMLKKTFNEGFDAINKRLDLGFAGISSEIGAMNAAMTAGFDQMKVSLDYWGNEICDKLDAIHDIVNNPLLTASRELYRRAVANAKKQFFEEALEDIKGAVEKNKTDYISWGLMGRIYLFGVSEFSNAIDVPKALEAFTNACKYISPDTDESEEAKKMAAEYYFYAAYANYILANESRIANKAEDVKKYLEDSIKANAKSYALSNTMYEALYDKARAYSLLEQKDNTLKAIEEAIRADGLYSVKVLGDPDFKWLENDIVSLITSLKDELYQKIQEIKPEVLKIIEDYEFFGGSFCELVKDSALNINNIGKDDPYFDIRSNYDKNILLLNTIKRNEIPFEEVINVDGKLGEFSATEDFFMENITDSQRKKALLPIGVVKLVEKKYNLKNYTLDVNNFCAALYENQNAYDYGRTENEIITSSKSAYKLAFMQDKYYDSSAYFFITNQIIKTDDGSTRYGGGSLAVREIFFGRSFGEEKNEHELICEYDENTKMILTCVFDEAADVKDDKIKIRYNKQHLSVLQKGIVSKKYLKEREERIQQVFDAIKAVQDAKEAEIAEKAKEEEERKQKEIEKEQKDKKRKKKGYILAVCSLGISITIGCLIHHPFIGGLIGVVLAWGAAVYAEY